MCSRAAWKKLEALSNQQGSSDCYPFNYVVWVSTVVIAEAGWGHASGGLCLWRMCVYVCACKRATLAFCGARRLYVSAGLQCLCFWRVFARLANYKCLSAYSLFVVHQRVPTGCVIHSFSRSESSETCLCISPQGAGISGWLHAFLSWLLYKLLTPPFMSLCVFRFLSILLPLRLHLSSLLLFLPLCSLTRWQAVLGHRYRLSSDRCGHLS